MRSLRRMVLVLAASLAAFAASAHEGGTDARGTVKEITSERLVLTTQAGAELRIALVPGTRIRRGARTVPVTDVRPGERAVVHAATREGTLEATEVKLGERRE